MIGAKGDSDSSRTRLVPFRQYPTREGVTKICEKIIICNQELDELVNFNGHLLPKLMRYKFVVSDVWSVTFGRILQSKMFVGFSTLRGPKLYQSVTVIAIAIAIAIAKQMQKPQPWTDDELRTLLRAVEFVHLHCPGTFPVDLSTLQSTDLLTSAMLEYVRGLNNSVRNLGSYLLEAQVERFSTRGLELIPYNKDLVVVDPATRTVRLIRQGNFATFHKHYPVIECEIRLRDYPSEGDIWIGLLDEEDEDINIRMWTLLEDALTNELDHGNQAWKEAGN